MEPDVPIGLFGGDAGKKPDKDIALHQGRPPPNFCRAFPRFGVIVTAPAHPARGVALFMPSPDPLDDLLDRWQTPATPARLPTRVHHEIAAAAGQTDNAMTRFLAAFSRPSFAAAFIIACVLLGLFLAESRVSRLHAAYGSQVARSYVQLIDPLVTGPLAATPAAKGAP